VRVAVIGAGTNSCRLLMVRRDGAAMSIEHHDIRGTRRGEGIAPGGQLSPEAVKRTIAAMTEFAQLAKRADRMLVIGTNALREASNAAMFERGAREGIGADVRVLTGEEEARASFAGATWALERAGIALSGVTVVDVGGGSTEIAVRAERGAEVRVRSLPLGAVRLTERFFKSDPPAASELTACRTAVRVELDRLGPGAAPVGVLVAVGGTADTAARMLNAYDPAAPIHVANVKLADLADLLRLTSSLPLDARKRLHGLPESRADIFPAGLIIIEEIARRAEVTQFWVSESDLLLGLALETFES